MSCYATSARETLRRVACDPKQMVPISYNPRYSGSESLRAFIPAKLTLRLLRCSKRNPHACLQKRLSRWNYSIGVEQSAVCRPNYTVISRFPTRAQD